MNRTRFLRDLIEKHTSNEEGIPPAVEKIYNDQNLLYHSGFDRTSYVSIINGNFLLSAQDPEKPWKRLTAIDLRQEYPDSLFDPPWLRTYILPLMAYFRASNWQDHHLRSLEEFNSRLDELRDEIRAGSEPYDEIDYSKNNVDNINSYQNDLESIQYDWIDRYSSVTSLQQKLVRQASEMDNSSSESSTYEKEINTPNREYVFVDDRSLLTRYSEELSDKN